MVNVTELMKRPEAPREMVNVKARVLLDHYERVTGANILENDLIVAAYKEASEQLERMERTGKLAQMSPLRVQYKKEEQRGEYNTNEDNGKERILNYLREHPTQRFTVNELIEHTNTTRANVYCVMSNSAALLSDDGQRPKRYSWKNTAPTTTDDVSALFPDPVSVSRFG